MPPKQTWEGIPLLGSCADFRGMLSEKEHEKSLIENLSIKIHLPKGHICKYFVSNYIKTINNLQFSELFVRVGQKPCSKIAQVI